MADRHHADSCEQRRPARRGRSWPWFAAGALLTFLVFLAVSDYREAYPRWADDIKLMWDRRLDPPPEPPVPVDGIPRLPPSRPRRESGILTGPVFEVILFGSFHLLVSALGGVLLAGLAGAVRQGGWRPVLGWGLRGGGVAVLLLAGGAFLLGWFDAPNFGPVGHGKSHGLRPAIGTMMILVVLLGLPAFAIGTMIGSLAGSHAPIIGAVTARSVPQGLAGLAKPGPLPE